MYDKHAIADDYIIIEEDFGIVACEALMETEEPEPVVEKVSPTTVTAQMFFKSERRLQWEQRNPKVHAKVDDGQGHELEIREINRGRQLGFWNDTKNAQTYVHKQKDNTFECKGSVFQMKTKI
jgi:hypothetical protein